MIKDFNGKKIANSLNVFNYYKRLTGNSLEVDLKQFLKLQDLVDKKGNVDLDIIPDEGTSVFEILQYIYYAMRCAGEKKELDLTEVLDELTVEDLSSPPFMELINFLVGDKKKELEKVKSLNWLARKSRQI